MLKFNSLYRYPQLDVLKFILAILVLLRHCGQVLFEPNSLFMVIINIFSPLAVPTFFSISGFLFFNKKRKPEYLWKYVWRVAKLYLVWTVIFLPLIFSSYLKNGMGNITGLLKFIQNFLFSGSYYHLWFLPALIFAIIVVFFVSKKVTNKWLLIMAVVLFITGTLVDTYSYLSPYLSWVSYKSVFLTTRNGLFFGIPFIAIGKVIAEKNYKTKWWLLITSFFATMAEGYYLVFGINKVIVNMNISSLILVPSILIFILNLPRLEIDGNLLRKASTLIFCAHPIAIILISHFVGGWIGAVAVLLLTVTGAFIGAKLSENFKVINLLM